MGAITFAEYDPQAILSAGDPIKGNASGYVDRLAWEATNPFSSVDNQQVGDVWLNQGRISDPVADGNPDHNFQFAVVLHEIGHALGLEHSELTPNGPEVPPNLTGVEDTVKYTIMVPGTEGHNYNNPDMYYTSGEPYDKYTTSLQLYDVAAIQDIYGRNYFTRYDDTSYDLGHGLAGGTPETAFTYTIWDGGGTDIVAASGYATPAQIDLRQGHFSSIGSNGDPNGGTVPFDSVGYDAGNVAIAYYTIIENAFGTYSTIAGDSLIGNAWDNILYGAAGNDKLYGDGVSYDHDAGFHDANTLQDGTGSVYAYGPDDVAPATDNSGDDILLGGAGNDVLYGGKGNDILHGGLWADDLPAGFDPAGQFLNALATDQVDWHSLGGVADGYDTASYANLDEAITFNPVDFTVTKQDGGVDHLYSIEKIVGNPIQHDTLSVPGTGTLHETAPGHFNYNGQAFELQNFTNITGDSNAQTFSLYAPSNHVIDGGGGTDTVTYAQSVVVDETTGHVWNAAGTGRDTLLNVAVSETAGRIVAGSVAVQAAYGVPLDALRDYSAMRAAAAINIDVSDRFTHFNDVAYFYEATHTVVASVAFGGQAPAITGVPSIDIGFYTSNPLDVIAALNATGEIHPVYLEGTNFGDTVTLGSHGLVGVNESVHFTAGTGDDDITIAQSSQGVYLTYLGGHDVVHGAQYLSGLTIAGDLDISGMQMEQDGGGTTVSFADGEQIVLQGYTGSLSAISVSSLMSGTWGDDRRLATYADGQTLYALGGDDVITAGPGHSILYGGAGNDRYIVSGAAGHFAEIHDLSGTADGINRIELTDVSSSALTASVSDGMLGLYNNGVQFASVDGYDSFGTLSFSDGKQASVASLLNGTPQYFNVAGGNDFVVASTSAQSVIVDLMGGSDTFIGSSHGDTVFAGDDSGGYSLDYLQGGSGNDHFYAGSGATYMIGGAGNDVLQGGSNPAGSIAYYANDPSGVTVDLSTGIAHDGYGGTDTLIGIGTVYGSNYADTMAGTDANDSFYGNNGNDVFHGQGGDDYFSGGQGNDVLDGGNGNDFADFFHDVVSGHGVTADLGAGTATDPYGNTDTLISIENVGGTDNNDTLIGSGADNQIFGNGGNDLIIGGGGNDYINGGDGTDTVSFANAASAVTVDLSANTAIGDGNTVLINIENVIGSSHDDIITGDSSNSNVLMGGAGSDTYNLWVSTEGSGKTITVQDDSGSADKITLGFSSTSAALVSSYIDGSNLHIVYDSSGADNEIVIQNQYTADSSGNRVNSIETIEYSDHVAFSLPSFILGGSGGDTITGTSGADVIDGGTGYDTVHAGAGNDVIFGSEVVYGEGGNDTIYGTTGTDHIYGGAGDDHIYGGGGYDVLDGGQGNDYIDGGAQGDWTVYSDADSPAGVTVNLATGTAIDGWGNTDTLVNVENIIGSDYADTLTASSTGTSISAGDGNDTINGGAGDDTLNGEGGNDVIYGGAGFNTMDGGAGNDIFHGESGTDTATYANSTSGVSVNITTGTTSDGLGGTDTLINIERFTGSSHDDMFIGDGNANRIDAGAGNDTISYETATSYVTVSLATTSAQNTHGAGTDTLSNFENLTGSSYNDTLTGDGNANVINGGAGNDTISAGAGNDTLIGGTGNDSLDGGSGTDTVSYAGAASGVTVSLTSGIATGDGSDTLSNIENVTGSSHDDTITGSSGANVLDGGAGNDTIDGGGGADDLYGGSGADAFLFKAATAFSNSITVHDFSTSEGDKIDIHDLLTSYDPLTSLITDFVHIEASGGNAIVSVDANGTAGGSSYTQIATLAGQSALAGTEADLLVTGHLLAA